MLSLVVIFTFVAGESLSIFTIYMILIKTVGIFLFLSPIPLVFDRWYISTWILRALSISLRD